MPRYFRPRLVIPVEYATPWARGGHEIELDPVSGRLAFAELRVTEEQIDDVLDFMTSVSADWLQKHLDAPSILGPRARYRREPKGENDYLALPVSLGLYDAEYRAVTGHGPFTDCEDLEIGVSAEARVREGDALARPRKRRVSEAMWHITTKRGDGREQDSSRLLLDRA